MLGRILQILFFAIIVKPILYLIIGLRVHNGGKTGGGFRPNLPKNGPAIIAANHNSHLDTVVLQAMFPLRQLHKVRPAAAADYWMRNRWIEWFATTIIGVVPVERIRPKEGEIPAGNPLAACNEALANGDILIFFPEGSRGEPEKMAEFKSGLGKMVEQNPDAEVIPVFLHGFGKAWPKGSNMIVPFVLDVLIGPTMRWENNRDEFMNRFRYHINQLAAQGNFAPYN